MDGDAVSACLSFDDAAWGALSALWDDAFLSVDGSGRSGDGFSLSLVWPFVGVGDVGQVCLGQLGVVVGSSFTLVGWACSEEVGAFVGAGYVVAVVLCLAFVYGSVCDVGP